jgi:myo-inositol-1(or 4)-monophosphatase
LRQGYGQQHIVQHKGRVDLVTEVDQRSEACLLDYMRSHFADHTVIIEESGRMEGNKHQCWYIDPLDGTTNYAHGLQLFSVSIAYVEDGLTRLAVVYDPMHNECFSAERGKGAWLNGEPIHTGSTETLLNSLLVTGFPYDLSTSPENNLKHFNRLSALTQGVRRLGSAALDLSYVACGRLDGYWELKLRPWDIAAGALIAAEAGAQVTNMDGSPLALASYCTVIAANSTLHPQIMQALQQN